MAFDKLKDDISILLTEMQNEPQDVREIHLALKEKLNELKAFGMPLPDDLVKLEQDLDRELTADAPAPDTPAP